MLATVKRAPCAALASLVLVALVAGCGGGSHTGTTAAHSTGASASTASATTPTAPATPPKASATTPASQATSTASSTQAPANAGTYGHSADAAERAAVTHVVQAYYAALSSGHEVAACGMLAPHIQALLERSIRRTRLLHGKGCVGAFKLIFGQGGRNSSISPTVSVTGVRVDGDNGYALFSTQTIPSAQIHVERERGAWKIASLIGSPLGESSASSGG